MTRRVHHAIGYTVLVLLVAWVCIAGPLAVADVWNR